MAGANPFLMMEEEFSSAPAANLNPFLMGDSAFPSANDMPGDNPFFSSTPFESAAVPANNATNPFAFDPEPVPANTATPAVDSFFSSPPKEQTNIFDNINGAVPLQPVHNVQQVPMQPQNIVNDFFTTDNTQSLPNDSQMIYPEPVAVQKPDMLDLKQTNSIKKTEEVIHAYSSDEELTKVHPKRPPPPPRPVVPPSKETQDLIMSVTGAMDATSSHLLDRIPPTRTPSPVSMRDLHSPSPTPDHVFSDLLDVEGTKSQPVTNTDVNLLDVSDTTPTPQTNPLDNIANDPFGTQPTDNRPNMGNPDPFMSLMSENQECDINQNHSVQSHEPPARPPVIPMRPQPPRPQPPRPPAPQKPPPPIIRPHVEPTPVPVQPTNHDLFGEMIGEPEKTVEKPVASTADIMSLYSAPPVVSKPEPLDLLCDSTEPTPVAESLISPELSQHDIHMDTSDTQSKGSGSSATFNPFTSEETIVPAMLDTSSPIKSQNDITHENMTQDNIFDNSTIESNMGAIENDVFSQNDDVFDAFNAKFDSFNAKFDSAAKDTGKSNFDPFSGGTAWGDIENDNIESGNGFDADEPFDAFLSMQGPPAVPQGTPAMLSKRESQESDEDNFSVFIK